MSVLGLVGKSGIGFLLDEGVCWGASPAEAGSVQGSQRASAVLRLPHSMGGGQLAVTKEDPSMGVLWDRVLGTEEIQH